MHQVKVYDVNSPRKICASNMRGQNSGLQKGLCDLRTNALYVHFAAHNLNHVVNDSVKEVVDVTNFFGLVQSI